MSDLYQNTWNKHSNSYTKIREQIRGSIKTIDSWFSDINFCILIQWRTVF